MKRSEMEWVMEWVFEGFSTGAILPLERRHRSSIAPVFRKP